MKKKWVCILIACALSLCGAFLYGYHYVNEYLKDKYGPNTWVDGIYCTGQTVDFVNSQLIEDLDAPSITVTDREGEKYTYDLADADFQYDYSAFLEQCRNDQNAVGWTLLAKSQNEIALDEPDFTYDVNALKTWWDGIDAVKAEEIKPELTMNLEDQGYVLESTLEDHLDVEKGFQEVVNAISERKSRISLTESHCYFDYEMDEEQTALYETWKNLRIMETCGLVYDMGAEKIPFDTSVMSSFIAKDADGNPLLDENGKFYYDLEEVDAFVEELCERYHTYGVERPFKTSRESGEVVMVKPGNFGTELDVKAEKAFVREFLTGDVGTRIAKCEHQPVYLHETMYHGLDDTGGTYIEVDKEEQKIYFYLDGELMVTSGIVTGCLSTRHDTYEGAFCIQGKYKNKVLRGPGYASFVRRWMPIYRAIGLHDANWRKESEFGGETYKRNGSHGCVNMPDETTDIIFEYAEIGTPVFIFK